MLDYMKALLNVKFGLLRDESGQGMVEYVLIIVGVALVVMLTFPTLTDAISGAFENIAGNM
jgi:Flp pilus assembly pilin Flp